MTRVPAGDLILISVDDHIAEPAGMFDAHVPARFRDRAPRVVDLPDGSQQWFYGDVPGRNLGLNAVAGKPREYYNVNPLRYEHMRPGCYDVRARVADMSAGGVLAGLNFPNWTGFSGQVLNQGPDPDVNVVMIRAYNDWHIDEWCAYAPERFIPCGILPLFDAEEAAKEVRRLAGKGCHAVTFSENPAGLGMPSIHTDAWDPLFAACSDTGTVLACHVGSSSKSASTSADAPAPVPMNLSSVMAVYTLGDLLWADFWRRFPQLRFSLTEGDIGWIPYFLWRAEHTLDRHNGWMGVERPQGLSPTELFHERFLVCFINDRVGVKLLDEFSPTQVCWESDYPHSDSTWPECPERLWDLVADLDPELVANITHRNAMHHYGFDPFAVRPPERCTASALRAEAAGVDTVTHGGRRAGPGDLDYWRMLTGRVGARPASGA